MQLELFRHLWGIDQPWEQSFPRIRAEGYVGIESPMPPAEQAEKFLNLAKANGLRYLAMVFTNGPGVAGHIKSFTEQVQRAVKLGAVQITAHSGVDAWSGVDAVAYAREAVAIEKSLPVQVGHEIHRGRITYTPWATRDLLERVSEFKLTCDYSHWVVVAERLLPDCGEILQLAADRALHIHSRVGYEQGPQVPEPSAPEYRTHLEAHERWWDMIWDSQKRRGLATTTLTPEFGPPGYLHTLPHTNVPVADLWKVCKWTADRQRERFHAGSAD